MQHRGASGAGRCRSYYVHAETELAMMALVGGFDAAVLAAVPRELGYEVRQVMYPPYHVVNHLNRFGDGYARQVERTLRRLG
jgi:protein-ribulosamine 3-kinase